MNEFNLELAMANAASRADNLVVDAQVIAAQFYYTLLYLIMEYIEDEFTDALIDAICGEDSSSQSS